MKRISYFNLKNELKLTAAFLINRLMPILVFFVVFLCVSYLGTLHQIDIYAIHASWFNTFLALGLGMVSGIRFYAVQLPHKQIFMPIMVFAVVLGIIISISYWIYTSYFIGSHLHNTSLATGFAFCILIGFVYEFLVAYGESKRKVQGSDISNSLSLPMFLGIWAVFYLFFIPNLVDVVEGIVIAYTVSEFCILLVLSVFVFKNYKLFTQADIHCTTTYKNALQSVIVPVVIFIIPIIILQCLKRFAHSTALSALGHINGAAGILYTIFMISLLFASCSAAFSNNSFVVIVQQLNNPNHTSKQTIQSYVLYCALLMAILCLMVLVGILSVVWFLDWVNQPFLQFVAEYPVLLFCYGVFEIFIWSVLVHARAVGDTFRVHTIWLGALCMSALYFLLYSSITLQNIVVVFLLANMVACIFGVIWVYQNIHKKLINI